MHVVILKKYELVKDDQVIVSGHTLYRLRALRDFGNVKAGDLGGYIEKESNLSHSGDCWVHDNAYVYDDAQIVDDAQIYDNAQVFGNARVSGRAIVRNSALIFGDAQVCDDAQVSDNAMVFNNAQVSSKARVSDKAQVYDNAKVSGNARIGGYAQVLGKVYIGDDAHIQGDVQLFGKVIIFGEANISTQSEIVWFTKVGAGKGTLTIYKGKDGNLIATTGWITGTVDKFLAKSKQEYDARSHIEHRQLIEVAKSRILGKQKKMDIFLVKEKVEDHNLEF